MILKHNRSQTIIVFSVVGFFLILLFITAYMMLKNTRDLIGILEDTIESELISTSIAARGLIDVEAFHSYESMEDILNDLEAYEQTLSNLRVLQRQLDATYIYALKLIDGKYYFIFDTDEEEDTRFEEYEISVVHEKAFLGKDAAGIMNVNDEFGNFNTGAVPIWRNGEVIGIISTDIEDTFIQESSSTSNRNALKLILTLISAMCGMTAIIFLLTNNVRKMQDTLFKMANYDFLTGLPNRQYLMAYLPESTEKALSKKLPFAFFLIDLDNFKRVNDNAGHDAGDELLRHVGLYLESVNEKSKSFRPPAGVLNVSARIGGDEFVQIVPDISTEEEANIAAKKVLDGFTSQTINRYVEKYQVGMSIGVALFPYHTENFNVLIKYADIAMYNAKKRGKNNYSVYKDELSMADSNDDQSVSSGDRRKYRKY